MRARERLLTVRWMCPHRTSVGTVVLFHLHPPLLSLPAMHSVPCACRPSPTFGSCTCTPTTRLAWARMDPHTSRLRRWRACGLFPTFSCCDLPMATKCLARTLTCHALFLFCLFCFGKSMLPLGFICMCVCMYGARASDVNRIRRTYTRYDQLTGLHVSW